MCKIIFLKKIKLVFEYLNIKTKIKNILLFLVKTKKKDHVIFDKKINDYNIIVQRDKNWNSKEIYYLTIIVPVYNMEKYIRECILSLINQKKSYSFLIILIDDGSTDNGIKQIDDLLNISNIILYKKENGGVSTARNSGLNLINSKYVTFVDPDDYLDENFVRKMVAAAEGTDTKIVQCNYGLVDIESNDIGSINCEEKKKYDIPGYSCGKIFRTDLFRDIQFPINCSFEDTIINSLIISQTNEITFVPQPLYLYRQNPEGASVASQHDMKSYDTFELTYAVLEVRKKLKLKNNNEYLMYFLKLVILNYNRTIFLEKNKNKYYFYKTCEIVTEYFEKSVLDEYIMLKLENHELLKNLVLKNYSEYCIICFLF